MSSGGGGEVDAAKAAAAASAAGGIAYVAPPWGSRAMRDAGAASGAAAEAQQ
jgi:hypothetical protein